MARLANHAKLAKYFVTATLFFICALGGARSSVSGSRRYSNASGAELTATLSLALDIVVTATIDEVLTGAALAEDNRKHGIPEDSPPTLKLWSANLQDHLGQRRVRLVECDPEPTRITTDRENGNRIFYWDFSRDLKSSTALTIRRRYRFEDSFYDPHAERVNRQSYPAYQGKLVSFYTKSEPYEEITDDITSAARNAIGDAATPLEKARRIFRFVRQHMKYEYPPPGGRGASVALACGKGDCGQYADLFIAMCRAVGIPARLAAGFHIYFGDGKDKKDSAGSHAWAELLLPGGEWIPADATGDEEKYFARKLDNTHVTASVGRSIPLPGVPECATYKFSEVENGRTTFMQSCTEYLSGIRGHVDVSRHVEKTK